MKNSRFSWLAALTLAVALAVAGCVTPEPVAPPPTAKPLSAQEIAALLNLGYERLGQGRFLEASDAFRASLRLGPLGEQAMQARLGLGKAEMGSGNYEQALPPLKDLLAMGPRAPVALEATLLTAKAERILGQHQAAVSRLRGLLAQPPQPLSAGQRREALQGLVESLTALGQPAQAASYLVLLAQEAPPAEAPALAGRVYETAAKAPAKEVERLLPQAVNPQVRAAVLLALGRAQLKEGRLDQAGRTLDQVKALPELAAELLSRLSALEQDIASAQSINARVVGVILPLSGNYAGPGRQVLAAVELGLGLFAGGPDAPTLFIEDDKGDSQAAVEAVNRLAETRKVIAIIGPLSAGPSAAAARQAQGLGVPLISLSQAEGITKAGDFVFQNFFSPAEQVAALLDEVMDKRGQRRFAILAPRTTYGQGFAKLFDAGVVARGGQVMHNMAYEQGTTDFADYLKEMVRLPPGSYRGGVKPQVDFQGLFVPDSPERVALIAPQLEYLGISGVTLLGTNFWHNPKLLDMAGRSLEGCLFPDGFDPGAAAPQVPRFVADYRQAMGREPNVVEAHGYDAALLVRRLLDNPTGPRTRTAFRDALAEVRNQPGVCGDLTVDPDRRVSKPLTLFTVRGGVFKTQASAEAEAMTPELLMMEPGSSPSAPPPLR